MASQSQSPSITQFFKAQRKRPRTGKDEGVVSSSKKILLEGGSGKSSLVLEDDAPIKPVVQVVDKPVKLDAVKVEGGGTEEKKKKKKKVVSTTKKKKSAELSSGQPKVSSFAKPSSSSSSSKIQGSKPEDEVTTSKPSEEVPHSSDKLPEVIEAPPREATPPPPPQQQQPEMAVKNIEQPVEIQEPSSGTPVKGQVKPVDSPVKFLKLGSLSPVKKKKMTAEQVARLLKKKNKLSELKSALEGINQGAQKLTEFRRTVAQANAKMSPVQKAKDDKECPGSAGKPISSASKALKEVSPAHFYSPSADRALKSELDRLSAQKVPHSPSKLVNMNNKVKKRLFEEGQQSTKEADKKVPAYARFHNLAQKTAAEKGNVSGDEIDLPLPYHFKVLKELFSAVETVLGIMQGRKEVAVFPKVKAGVQSLMKKISLREKHLAQMVTLMPGCYTFGLDKSGKETNIKIEVEHLVPSVICARRKAFHAALVKICLEHHKNFLLGLVPPIVVPVDKQITRWHPSFNIDGIPDIIPNEDCLPVKPAPEKISSARDVIAKAQNILDNANPRMRQAMNNMLNNSDGNVQQKVIAAEQKPKSAATLKNLKGVSQSLLEKIRNREREKLLNEMTRSPADSKRLLMMKKLPSFIKIIRNMIVAEKKVALPMEIVVERASHSIQGMGAGDTNAHIRLLVTLLPHWIKIVKLSHSDQEYLRIDKALDINNLLHEMDEIIKKHAS